MRARLNRARCAASSTGGMPKGDSRDIKGRSWGQVCVTSPAKRIAPEVSGGRRPVSALGKRNLARKAGRAPVVLAPARLGACCRSRLIPIFLAHQPKAASTTRGSFLHSPFGSSRNRLARDPPSLFFSRFVSVISASAEPLLRPACCHPTPRLTASVSSFPLSLSLFLSSSRHTG